jgi:hypothetical protein
VELDRIQDEAVLINEDRWALDVDPETAGEEVGRGTGEAARGQVAGGG